MSKLSKRVAFGLVLAALGTSSAYAAKPGSIVGVWSAIANQSAITLNITSQASSGVCRAVAGTLGGNGIDGFYCPKTGRFFFSRSGVQLYEGYVSENGPTLRMGGTFADINSNGDFNFQAQK